MSKFETFEHKADVGIRGWGESPEEALSNILKALASLLVETTSFFEESPKVAISIEVSSEFLDELLVKFINRVLSLTYLERVIFYEFRGRLEKEEEYLLKGELWGVAFEPDRYGYGVEVKGATFTMAEFQQRDSLFIAQCVVDV
ncbi:MAG: archease [Caldimicrobium sp.]|nr:archease [Caldimicrobium sp.]MCX7613673.1 archease [Caldimicrobium sp.]MDW8182702.1 archease [Caldimicrobium sp.]